MVSVRPGDSQPRGEICCAPVVATRVGGVGDDAGGRRGAGGGRTGGGRAGGGAGGGAARRASTGVALAAAVLQLEVEAGGVAELEHGGGREGEDLGVLDLTEAGLGSGAMAWT